MSYTGIKSSAGDLSASWESLNQTFIQSSGGTGLNGECNAFALPDALRRSHSYWGTPSSAPQDVFSNDDKMGCIRTSVGQSPTDSALESREA